VTAATATPATGFDILRAPLDDPSVWRGRDIAARKDWVITMTPEDLAEIDTALQPGAIGNAGPAGRNMKTLPNRKKGGTCCECG